MIIQEMLLLALVKLSLVGTATEIPTMIVQATVVSRNMVKLLLTTLDP